MIVFLYRRIVNNKWLFLCLLLGALSTTGIVGAIPMYANGIFQKVLQDDLARAYAEEAIHPGRYRVLETGNGLYNEGLLQDLNQLEQHFVTDLVKAYSLPILQEVRQKRYDKLYIQREGDTFYNDLDYFAYPTSLEGYEEHVSWVSGQAPKGEAVNGIYEVAVSEQALKSLQLMTNTVYQWKKKNVLEKTYTEILSFQITGVFTVENVNDPFWTEGRYGNFGSNILFEEGAWSELFDGVRPLVLKDFEQTVFFDYTKLHVSRTKDIIGIYQRQALEAKSNSNMIYVQLPMINLLNHYEQREGQLKITLWIIMIPLLMIMAFYAVIVSNLIIKNDRNEIALLKSRGAKRSQIFKLYFWECMVIALFSILFGPFLSKLICRFLGASNGFLEFVSRKPLMAEVNVEVMAYALLAAMSYCVFIMLPVIKASRLQIVEYKRSLLNDGKKPLWQVLFLDVILVGVSLYGWNLFQNRQEILAKSGLKAEELKIDPLLFFISTLFIVGMSLLLLRIYPWIVRIFFTLGEKIWHPIAYFSLVNVGRADKNLQAIMLFLILSISFGLMNANQARTINMNTADRVAYQQGADVVIEPYNNLKHIGTPPAGLEVVEVEVPYLEPPYHRYKELEGVEKITKVYHEKDVRINGAGGRVVGAQVYGIKTDEFGEIAWFRNDILPHHIYDYLNLIAKAPKAILLSGNIRDEFGIQVGDSVSVTMEGLGTLECTVYAFVDYFPTYMPNNEEGRKNFFAVVNAGYIEDQLPLHPYEIWIKKGEGATDSQVNQSLMDQGLKVESIRFMDQEMVKKKNDPMLLGTNGSLTMSFIIEMLITAIGFLLFWVLSIRERSLKFGIFRAIGMPMRDVGLIMLLEQVLVSGVAIAMGFLLGGISSKLFIPLLEVVYSSSQQVPQFKVIAYPEDYVKVLSVIIVMVFSCLIVLRRQVRQSNVNQIIKLGEDS